MKFLKRKLLALMLSPLRPFMGARTRKWVTGKVNPWGTLYIPYSLGVDGFFRALEQAGVNAVVLRWFEELPYVEKGHDLDILVPDQAIDIVRSLLSDWPRGQRIDFYSETGLKGTGYRPRLLGEVPAFPPEIATKILQGATPCPGGWSIPGPREHFLGLAYHAVYLKGFKSGLPPSIDTPAHMVGSRDYSVVLTDLGQAIGNTIAQPVTMASLDEMLITEGWRPSEKHLNDLAPANPWIPVAP